MAKKKRSPVYLGEFDFYKQDEVDLWICYYYLCGLYDRRFSEDGMPRDVEELKAMNKHAHYVLLAVQRVAGKRLSHNIQMQVAKMAWEYIERYALRADQLEEIKIALRQLAPADMGYKETTNAVAVAV